MREATLVKTFVELADSLVDDFDIVDLLTVLVDRCVEVLDVDAAGIMVANPDGELRVVASSSDAMRVLELFELQTAEGPCPESFRTGQPVVAQLSASGEEWPQFSPRAVEAGFESVHALPMRLRGQTLGALNMFLSRPGQPGESDLAAAQAFADVATIAILQNRAATAAQVVNTQLTNALHSRVIIEQAKGMIAERLGLDMSAAFERLRNHARRNNLRLVDVAADVVGGSQAPAALDDTTKAAPKPR